MDYNGPAEQDMQKAFGYQTPQYYAAEAIARPIATIGDLGSRIFGGVQAGVAETAKQALLAGGAREGTAQSLSNDIGGMFESEGTRQMAEGPGMRAKAKGIDYDIPKHGEILPPEALPYTVPKVEKPGPTIEGEAVGPKRLAAPPKQLPGPKPSEVEKAIQEQQQRQQREQQKQAPTLPDTMQPQPEQPWQGKTAPKFYSHAEKVAAEKLPPRAPIAQVAATLKNSGIHSEELAPIEKWLKDEAKLRPDITKNEVLAKIRETTPQIEEAVKSEQLDNSQNFHQKVLEWMQEKGYPEKDITDWVNDWDPQASQRIAKEYRDAHPSRTKYHEYQVPGGNNYRELLMKLPSSTSKVEKAKLIDESAKKLANSFGVNWEDLPEENRNRYRERVQEIDPQGGGARNPGDFTSTHWPDDPNTLAHTRVNDRVIDGKKTLFAEELQSDWHQNGRKIGYGKAEPLTPEERAEFQKLESLPDKVRTPEQTARRDELVHKSDAFHRGDGVPDAPFKKTWPELLLKRLVSEAAEKGHDQLAWTDGATQASRYDLSHHVDQLTWDPKSGELKGMKGDPPREVVNESNVPAEKLPDYIGKEAADKMINNPTSKYSWGTHVLEGQDLKVGGAGMKGFYDTMLPNMANKLFGKWGAKVEQRTIKVNRSPTSFKTQEEYLNHPGDNKTVHVLPITPELRAKALNEGFPLFSGADKVAGPVVQPKLPTPPKKVLTTQEKQRARQQKKQAGLPTLPEDMQAQPTQQWQAQSKSADWASKFLTDHPGADLNEPFPGYHVIYHEGKSYTADNPQGLNHPDDLYNLKSYKAASKKYWENSHAPTTDEERRVEPDLPPEPEPTPKTETSLPPHIISQYTTETQGKQLSLYPKQFMREYTDAEFPWEWREYDKYGRGAVPDAFKDQADFKAKYDAAPLVHLKEDAIKKMDYATAGSYFGKGEDYARESFAHHRDMGRILDQIHNKDVAPPIVLLTDKGLRILGGNTRLSTAAALNYNLPVKLIDVRKTMGVEQGAPMQAWHNAPKTIDEWANVEGQNPDLKEPPLASAKGLPLATGIVIQEKDGSIWLMHPKGQYGGYNATFPKGRLEPGLSPQANAIKEAYEETGFKVKILSHLLDLDKTTTRTRYYLGERVGGKPTIGPETEKVSRVTLDQLRGIADHPSDLPVIKKLEAQKPLLLGWRGPNAGKGIEKEGVKPYKRLLQKYPEHQEVFEPHHVQAISDWTNGTYGDIGRHIYNGDKLGSTSAKTMRGLDDLLEKATLPTNLTLWRGINRYVYNDLQRLKPGDVWDSAGGYQATSLSHSFASGWKEKHYKIIAPRGTRGAIVGKHTAASTTENEVILPRAQPMFYQGRDHEGVMTFQIKEEAPRFTQLPPELAGAAYDPNFVQKPKSKTTPIPKPTREDIADAKDYLDSQSYGQEKIGGMTDNEVIQTAMDEGWLPPAVSPASSPASAPSDWKVVGNPTGGGFSIEHPVHGLGLKSNGLGHEVWPTKEQAKAAIKYYDHTGVKGKPEAKKDFGNLAEKLAKHPENLTSANQYLLNNGLGITLKEGNLMPTFDVFNKGVIQKALDHGWKPEAKKDFGNLAEELAKHAPNYDAAKRYLWDQGKSAHMNDAGKIYKGVQGVIQAALDHGWKPKTVAPQGTGSPAEIMKYQKFEGLANEMAKNPKNMDNAVHYLLNHPDMYHINDMKNWTPKEKIQEALFQNWQPKVIEPPPDLQAEAKAWLQSQMTDPIAPDQDYVKWARQYGWNPDKPALQKPSNTPHVAGGTKEGNLASFIGNIKDAGWTKGSGDTWNNADKTKTMFIYPTNESWDLYDNKSGTYLQSGKGFQELQKHLDKQSLPVKKSVEDKLNEAGWVQSEGAASHVWHSPKYDYKLILEKHGDWTVYPNDGSGRILGEGNGPIKLDKFLPGKPPSITEESLKDAEYVKVPGGVSGQHWWNEKESQSVFLQDNGDWSVHNPHAKANEKSIKKGSGFTPLINHLDDLKENKGKVNVPDPDVQDLLDWANKKGKYAPEPQSLKAPEIVTNIETAVKKAGWEFNGKHPDGYDTWKKGKESLILKDNGDWEYIDFGKKARGESFSEPHQGWGLHALQPFIEKQSEKVSNKDNFWAAQKFLEDKGSNPIELGKMSPPQVIQHALDNGWAPVTKGKSNITTLPVKPLTPQQKAAGYTQLVYHGKESSDPLQPHAGMHFGTKAAATDRLTISSNGKGTIHPAYLKRGKYLEMPDQGEDDWGWALTRHLGLPVDSDPFEHLRKQGYLGIKYKNDAEDIGSYSYIIADPSAVLTPGSKASPTLIPQKEKPKHGQAALHFKGNVYSADFHAEALDKMLKLNGYPKAKEGGIDLFLKDHPEADNLTSDHWGGITKTGEYHPFTKELGEAVPMPIDQHRRLGGRVVDLRGAVALLKAKRAKANA
jgi:8-oxo-dGTP pyrophosphatase MutT (NUDIX family)